MIQRNPKMTASSQVENGKMLSTKKLEFISIGV